MKNKESFYIIHMASYKNIDINRHILIDNWTEVQREECKIEKCLKGNYIQNILKTVVILRLSL